MKFWVFYNLRGTLLQMLQLVFIIIINGIKSAFLEMPVFGVS